MSQDLHRRAERLVAASMVGEISRLDRQWLESHLEGCPYCAHRAEAVANAIQALRSVSVKLDPSLVRVTKERVRRRAATLATQTSQRVLWWTAAATSLSWMALSAPYVWRWHSWLAGQLGIPDWVWQMGFGLWWLLPALAALAVLIDVWHRLDPRGESPAGIARTENSLE